MEKVMLDDPNMGLFAPCLREELNISAEHNIYQVPMDDILTDGAWKGLRTTGAATTGTHTQESAPLTQALDDPHSQIKLRDALVSSLQFSKILGGSRAAGVDDSSFAWIDGKVYQPRFNPRVHDEADRGAHFILW